LANDILGARDAPDGSLWVGTPEGLHHFQAGRFRALTTRDGLLHNQATPLLVEEDGTLWVGTPRGLNRIRGEQIRAVTEPQGLYDNELFCLLDDGAEHYWANSIRGIFRLRKTDLHAVADRRQERLFCVSYGEADGAASAEGNGGYQPNACRAPDGRMWFPTTRGAVVLDPAALVVRQVPPLVVIEEVLAEDQLVFADGNTTALASPMRGTGSELRVPAGRAGVLEIHYTANSFVAPEKVQFRYRLEGADAQWRSAGTRRVAFYTNLRPRSYRFRVEASNQEGLWNEQPAELAFSIAPHFWETWPFYLLCGGTALGLGAAVQAYRLRWQRRLLKLEQQQALADERTRIARDLHDDLGTALTGLALELDVTRQQAKTAPAISQQLGGTAQRTRELAERMREVVWTVNPRCDTVSSLASFLEQQVGQFLHTNGLQVQMEFPVDIPSLPLTAEARHQLALGVREALTNVVRHAQASAVVVSLAIEDAELIVRVSDNGRGFGPVQEDGHGLESLRARMKKLGGHFDCTSAPGSGTTVTFRLPLTTAQAGKTPGGSL
jgi:signal transduction histidine kinase